MKSAGYAQRAATGLDKRIAYSTERQTMMEKRSEQKLCSVNNAIGNFLKHVIITCSVAVVARLDQSIRQLKEFAFLLEDNLRLTRILGLLRRWLGPEPFFNL